MMFNTRIFLILYKVYNRI